MSDVCTCPEYKLLYNRHLSSLILPEGFDINGSAFEIKPQHKQTGPTTIQAINLTKFGDDHAFQPKCQPAVKPP